MHEVSKRLFVRSSTFSLEFASKGFLEEEDRDDAVLCQVKYLTEFSAGSRKL